MKKNVVVYVVVFLAALALGFGMVAMLKPSSKPEPKQSAKTAAKRPTRPSASEPVSIKDKVLKEIAESDPQSLIPAETQPEPEVQSLPQEEAKPELELSVTYAGVVYNGNSFRLSGYKVLGTEEPMLIVLKDVESGKSYTDTGGKIDNIAHNLSGNYTLELRDQNSALVQSRSISVKKPQMSATELTGIIAECDGDTERGKSTVSGAFASYANCSVVCNGKKSSMRALFSCRNEGVNVTVTKLVYSLNGKIIKVEAKSDE